MVGLLVVFAGLGFWWVASGSGVASADGPPAVEGEAPPPSLTDDAVLYGGPSLERSTADRARAAVAAGPEPVVSRALRYSHERGTAHGICVSAEDGEPVPGVPVEIVVLLKRETTRTDAEGRFAFNVPSGPAVWIELGSSTPWILGEPKILLSQAQQDGREEIRLELYPGARVVGRVVDEATREPVGDVTVRLRTDSRYTDSVTTDAAGVFVSAGALPSEQVHAEVWEDGVRLERASWLPFRAPEAVASEWDPDSADAWVIEVPIGPTYAFDLGDEPVGGLGARLLSIAESGEVTERGSWRRLRDGLAPWVRFTSPVRARSGSRFAVEVGTPDRRRRTTIDVESAVGVYPRVLKVHLEQTAGLRVEIVEAGGERVDARAQLVPLGQGSSDDRSVKTLHTVRRGLAVEGVEPGPWRLVASVGAQRFTRDVVVGPGENDLGKWVIEKAPGAAIRGTLSFEPKSWLFDDMNPRVLVYEASTRRLVAHVEVDDKRFFARKIEAPSRRPCCRPASTRCASSLLTRGLRSGSWADRGTTTWPSRASRRPTGCAAGCCSTSSTTRRVRPWSAGPSPCSSTGCSTRAPNPTSSPAASSWTACCAPALSRSGPRSLPATSRAAASSWSPPRRRSPSTRSRCACAAAGERPFTCAPSRIA